MRKSNDPTVIQTRHPLRERFPEVGVPVFMETQDTGPSSSVVRSINEFLSDSPLPSTDPFRYFKSDSDSQK